MSLQFNEASDLVNKEYLSIVFRYTLSGVPVERFVGFYSVHDRDVDSLFELLKSVLSFYDCDPKKSLALHTMGPAL